MIQRRFILEKCLEYDNNALADGKTNQIFAATDFNAVILLYVTRPSL